MKHRLSKRKKGPGHMIRNLTAALFILFLSVTAFSISFLGIRGYRLYQDAMAEMSIEEKVESIREKEHFTSYCDLPEFYVNALISVEDHRFRSHSGIDPIALCRALWTDIQAQSFKEGGSTLTQQLAKNLFFSQAKTLERKVAEALAALALERRYSKNEILELYANTAYFGSGYYGIYDAAMGYFHKQPSELTDYESALLAGIPNAPSAYSPNVNSELASQRVGQVLRSLVRNELITQEEAARIQADHTK